MTSVELVDSMIKVNGSTISSMIKLFDSMASALESLKGALTVRSSPAGMELLEILEVVIDIVASLPDAGEQVPKLAYLLKRCEEMKRQHKLLLNQLSKARLKVIP